MIMLDNVFVLVLSYAFSLFYGLAAVFLVFETRNHCPFRWPFFFGLIGALSHLASHELPPWWPPAITRDMLIALLLLVFIVLGMELLRRIINEHGLRYPWEPILQWYRDDESVSIFPRRFR